jgi:hypothetical protein
MTSQAEPLKDFCGAALDSEVADVLSGLLE